ncbi:arginase [Pasteurellaceae bacterium RH1A]|nr:arginase [Pasteurellaceae bacterium RH1A]
MTALCNSLKGRKMNKTLRLTFPQWQGADPAIMQPLVPELSQQDAAQGYFIGSQLLEWLAPASKAAKATVPVSLDYTGEQVATQQGIYAYPAVTAQLQAALDIIKQHQPDRIVTLGGECSVSVAPFSYLADKYQGDVAVVWIDAHPDLTLPNEGYVGYHAMALSALAGKGDEQIIGKLPAFIEPKNAAIVGFRSYPADVERVEKFGVTKISSASVNAKSDDVLAFLQATGKRKVLIHLDLDALDPADLRTAVAADPDGIKVAAVSRLIGDIAQAYDLVGLTIAEPMPREVIKLRNLLHSLPLLGE